MNRALLDTTSHGLYCAEGDFYIDPWRPVPRAVVTHAHADHACRGCERYLTSQAGVGVLRTRLGPDIRVDAVAYGETFHHNGVSISLHPAGHILGSSQVRVEHRGEVWVVSGDYKVEPDPTCSPFEAVRCHVFVSESTFGLPIYQWPNQAEVFGSINAWWRSNRERGKASLLFAYALGKAQRLLAGLDRSIGPVACHGAVERLNQAYRAAGIDLAPTTHVSAVECGTDWGGTLIVAPPSADGTPWMRSSARHRGRSPRAGCGSGERAGVDRSIVGSSSPTTPTGPACSQRSKRPAPAGSC